MVKPKVLSRPPTRFPTLRPPAGLHFGPKEPKAIESGGSFQQCEIRCDQRDALMTPSRTTLSQRPPRTSARLLTLSRQLVRSDLSGGTWDQPDRSPIRPATSKMTPGGGDSGPPGIHFLSNGSASQLPGHLVGQVPPCARTAPSFLDSLLSPPARFSFLDTRVGPSWSAPDYRFAHVHAPAIRSCTPIEKVPRECFCLSSYTQARRTRPALRFAGPK